MPAGQPALDLATRAKNWCWYWRIKALTGLSDDALDVRFATDQEGGARTRAFYRVRSIGSSPCDTRGYRKTHSLFRAVHEGDAENSKFESAKADFDSELWELLTQRGISPVRLREITNGLAARKGLAWITPADTSLIMELVEDDDLLRILGFDSPRRPMLQLLAEEENVASLAYLCALYLQSIAARHLKQAIEVASAVTRCVTRVGVRLALPTELARLLERLVDDRILHDIWLTEADFLAISHGANPRPARPSEANRRRQVRDLLDWYTSRKREAGHLADVGMPVQDSPALRWIRDNRDWLLTLRQELRDNEGKRRAYGDVPLLTWRDPAAVLDARARQIRADLIKTLKTLLPATPDLHDKARYESV